MRISQYILNACVIVFVLTAAALAQIPLGTAVQILKAEDARAYDKTLESLMSDPNPAIRIRAALAAGRIGNDAAVAPLTALLEKEQSEKVRGMAAFALGEIGSIKAADAILKALKAETRAVASVPPSQPQGTLVYTHVSARLVEAAGKIAAANPKEEKSKELGVAILATLEAENAKGANQSREVVLLGLTAALRAKPEGADAVVAKFLTSADARILADAANTLTRLKAKNANETLRKVLASDIDAVARANAARALGAAEDKEASNLLLDAATKDADSRVRVSAIRSLGTLNDPKVAGRLVKHGTKLLAAYKASKLRNPNEKNEAIEIAQVLGHLLAGTRNAAADALLREYAHLDDAYAPEFAVARIRIGVMNKSPGKTPEVKHWRQMSTFGQMFSEVAVAKNDSEEFKKFAAEASGQLRRVIDAYTADSANNAADPIKLVLAASDYLRAYALFKPTDLVDTLRRSLTHRDVIFRSTAAELLAEQPVSKENVEALKTAFTKALLTDKDNNDAQLAILNALYKLDKKESGGTLLVALSAPDYLVRKKAFELLADNDLQKDFPGIPASLEIARSKHKDQVLPYSAAFGTKLGQVLNTDADYRRALSRKNGTVKAVLTTEKGVFTIVFSPEEAPLTVDNFIKLARVNYFNGLEVHRVVPNFVMQDGDPRGDGNGGPGWSIRCEINMLPYDRGAVGMALSGKDTGGSQWFVTHSPQPHLDGGYTVFGHVNETYMKVVDNIVRGDKIISVKIVESRSPQRTQRKIRKN